MKTDIEKLLEDFEIKEHLEEMATVFSDKTHNLLCQVNPDSGRLGLEYFKIYNNFQWKTATKIARIEFRKPEYVIHTSNKENWVLNSHERKTLVKLLQMPSRLNNNFTNFQMAIIQFNLEKGLDVDSTLENKIDNLIYPDYLPIDLPIPNYLELR